VSPNANADFEALKQRYAAQRELQAAAKAQRALDEAAPPWALAEGVTPTALEFRLLDRSVAQIAENRARQQRLLASSLTPGALAARDSAQEQARLALGAAIEAAVTCGALDEERAIAMIVAGRVNDIPMDPEDAKAQVRASLAQAIAAGALSAAEAEQMLRAMAGSILDAPPTGNRAEDDPLEALVYAALRVRPCHDPSHDALHRYDPTLCVAQLGRLGQILVEGLGLRPDGLPRAPHRDPDGATAPCCARDGRTGTWLVYGQTQDPSTNRAASPPA
jgi:hypothetical protein